MDTIQEEGLEQDVLDSLALADSAIQQEGLASLVLFEGLRARRIRDNIGNGDVHSVMEFDDYFTTPATTANELTLEARIRLVNGVEYDVPQVTLTLPAASGVDTLVSNQTLIMFETSVVNVTVSNTFYAGSDLDTSSLIWANLDSATQQGYLEDTKNNLFVDGGAIKQYVFSHVITNLTQDYAKGDPQAIIDAGYTQGTVGDHFVRWTKTDIVAESIAMVQRRNQGAYEPAINPNGTAEFGDSLPWYSTTDDRATLADCFTTVGDGSISGAASGRIGGEFYDAIYASDVYDLRMSSRRVPRAELRERYRRKAIAGTVRGFGGVPFTKVFSSVGAVTGEYTIVNQDNTSAVVAERPQKHSQANPIWTDIIGDPERIAATFPNGVEGQWNPSVVFSPVDVPLNRKSLESPISVTGTIDDGVTWVNSSTAIDIVDNSIFFNLNSLEVSLFHYETQAYFTQDDNNSEILDWGNVFGIAGNAISQGALLGSTLVGKVHIGNTTSNVADTVPLIRRGLQLDTGVVFSGNGHDITHTSLTLGASNSTLATKMWDYLSESNGVGKLVYAYKEMVYDVTWGDNDKFEISDNQVADTDDNGNDIVRGTASFGIPFYLVESI